MSTRKLIDAMTSQRAVVLQADHVLDLRQDCPQAGDACEMNSLWALRLTSLVLAFATPALADTVLSIGDCDTLTVIGPNGRRTIRLACVDAPETAQTPYGYAARAALQHWHR